MYLSIVNRCIYVVYVCFVRGGVEAQNRRSLGSGSSSRKGVEVQVLSSAPNKSIIYKVVAGIPALVDVPYLCLIAI